MRQEDNRDIDSEEAKKSPEQSSLGGFEVFRRLKDEGHLEESNLSNDEQESLDELVSLGFVRREISSADKKGYRSRYIPNLSD